MVQVYIVSKKRGLNKDTDDSLVVFAVPAIDEYVWYKLFCLKIIYLRAEYTHMYIGKKKLKRVERIDVVFNCALNFCCLWVSSETTVSRSSGILEGLLPSWWCRCAIAGFLHLSCH